MEVMMSAKISLLRMRYILPLLWVAFALIGMFAVPALFPAVYVFSMPSIEIVNGINRSIYGPTDITYRDVTVYVALATVVQAFLLGLIIDLAVLAMKKRSIPLN